jgi:hypothetical protein
VEEVVKKKELFVEREESVFGLKEVLISFISTKVHSVTATVAT